MPQPSILLRIMLMFIKSKKNLTSLTKLSFPLKSVLLIKYSEYISMKLVPNNPMLLNIFTQTLIQTNVQSSSHSIVLLFISFIFRKAENDITVRPLLSAPLLSTELDYPRFLRPKFGMPNFNMKYSKTSIIHSPHLYYLRTSVIRGF